MTINKTAKPNNERGVIAVLGPTNTGKTHLAIERMTAHESGLIGLPLRLLAREVYGRVADRVGAANVALITGEEKINAEGNARFQVCTVEAMPDQTNAAFVAIDEVQLAADLERGHVFTDRLMNLRGRDETMLLGAETIRNTLNDLLPGINIVTRPRMSMLTWAGQKKITRLPRRSAIVAFSADEVYAIAELIRRQRGGAAVVLGSLSPRTRNAQVALYQSGDIDFLVATDAIGMGLNLDVDHVAFAQDRKFDGLTHRNLTPAEMGQIAGRAGRHIRDGTFGVTGQVDPFADELVQRLETHEFDPVKVLIWRNRDLDFSSISDLRASLEKPSDQRMLMKSFPAADLVALDNLSRVEPVTNACGNSAQVQLLWDVCQIPDYRRISPGEHAELLRNVFLDLASSGSINEDWFADQIKRNDRMDGDIDILSARIAHIRTWTYLSHRAGWLTDPAHWQEKTRDIEDRLSDALHQSLTKRFIDRRTSVLMKRLRENAMLEAEISPEGDVVVEGHHVGKLEGFRFTTDAVATGADAKAAANAATKALATEIAKRSERLSAAPNGDIALGSDGTMRWLGVPVGKLASADEILKPKVTLLADELLSGSHREQVKGRLDRWLSHHIETVLKPLIDLPVDQELTGTSRGVAFRIVEQLGSVDRREISSEVQGLDQDIRAKMRRHGVRFGAYNIFIPALLKPAPAELICLLWGLKNGRLDAPGLTEIPNMSAAGRTSFPLDKEIDPEIYRLCGFRLLGDKAVRIDILERLADLIRPAVSWRAAEGSSPPDGAIGDRSFYVTPAMLSFLGATHDGMEKVLKDLGYRGETKSLEDFEKLKPALPADATAQSRPESSSDPADQASTPKADASAEQSATKTEATDNVASVDAKSSADIVETNGVDKTESSASVETGGEDEQRTVMIWRTPRHDRNTNRRQRPGNLAGKENKFPGRNNDHKGRKSNHGNRQGDQKANRNTGTTGKHQPQRTQKRIDPDSPFAKLMDLKKQLEKDDG
ncbi:MAG: helicase-related protein [Rhizobiaceae bacterium]